MREEGKKMDIINIIILLLFMAIFLKQLKCIKELIIPTRKRYIEIIIVLLTIIILSGISYLYAKTVLHYITGLLGIVIFISMWFKEGITSKGFVRNARGEELIEWNKINKVIITSSKDIKITLIGGFIGQTMYFKKSDYDKVFNIIRVNLPIKTDVEIRGNVKR